MDGIFKSKSEMEKFLLPLFGLVLFFINIEEEDNPSFITSKSLSNKLFVFKFESLIISLNNSSSIFFLVSFTIFFSILFLIRL